MDLTETQKHSISEKLNRAIEAERVTLTEAARNLGTTPNYLSMIRNTTQWHKCAKSGWEAVSLWANSGQKLSEYCPAHGSIAMPENNELKPEVKKVLVAETKEALRAEAEAEREAEDRRNWNMKTYAEAIEEKEKRMNLIEKLEREAEKLQTPVKSVIPEPGNQFTDTARLKVELDIEIYLVINGQKVKIN